MLLWIHTKKLQATKNKMSGFSSSEKKKLFSLFENIKGGVGNDGLQKNINSDILLVDGLNTYIRSFMAIPSLNEDGLHTGGIAGFLKSIGYAIKLLSPTRVIIVFDGKGGSQKRRKIYPGYKNGRKTDIRLNRNYEELSSSQIESVNFKKELIRTVNYLDTLPVTVMAIDQIEADDTIAYLAKETFKDSNVTIMSTDKDFLQLASDKIKIWSPVKKKIFGCKEIVDEYGITCNNFVLYRVMEGDVSDNIPGLDGVGLKRVVKAFPFLSDGQQYGLQEIYNYSENNRGKYKIYDTVLDNKLLLERNHSLMQLSDTQVQSFTQLRIEEIIKTPIRKIDKMTFTKLITEDKMWNNIPNYHIWLNECFGKLNSFIE
jgi:5'-3' exonuclease